MKILFQEPANPRFIYVNPNSNKIHLLVHVVGGQEISTDNTCKANEASNEFFRGAALTELKIYKNALETDLMIHPQQDPINLQKQERLAQIKPIFQKLRK
jgi:hypothetical protein